MHSKNLAKLKRFIPLKIETLETTKVNQLFVQNICSALGVMFYYAFTGVVYIKFSKTSEAAKALEEMNGKTLGTPPGSRPLKVLVASRYFIASNIKLLCNLHMV